jgi:hypothetical protein
MHRLGIALLIGATMTATLAQAADFAPPARKSGLWKQTITSTQAGAPAQPPMTSTICIDPSVDRAVSVFGAGMGKQACTSNTITRTSAGYSFASVCQMGPGGTVRSQGSATGDFSKAYRVSMKSTTTGAAMAQMNGASATNVTAAWSGPCPAGQKPGDMVMPGGIKMNVLVVMGAAGKR